MKELYTKIKNKPFQSIMEEIKSDPDCEQYKLLQSLSTNYRTGYSHHVIYNKEINCSLYDRGLEIFTKATKGFTDIELGQFLLIVIEGKLIDHQKIMFAILEERFGIIYSVEQLGRLIKVKEGTLLKKYFGLVAIAHLMDDLIWKIGQGCTYKELKKEKMATFYLYRNLLIFGKKLQFDIAYSFACGMALQLFNSDEPIDNNLLNRHLKCPKRIGTGITKLRRELIKKVNILYQPQIEKYLKKQCA